MVGEARDGEEAVRAAADLSPNVVVMDVMMPNKDGVEACREIMEFAPETRVVMLTASTEEDAVREVAAGATGYLQKVSGMDRLLDTVREVAAGATGYLQKVSGMDRLLDTVREVAAGELRVPAEVVTRVFAGIRRGAEQEELGPAT